MPWVPIASAAVAYVATFELSAPVPTCVVPSRKATIPDGAGLPVVPVTVAVKVTLAPVSMFVAEGVRAVVVPGSALTVSVAVAVVRPGLAAEKL